MKQTHPGEGVGERILLMTTQADGEEEDVAITIIEAIIQLSQEAIVIRPTVERKGDGTGCLKKILILARCRIQLHIIWVTAVEETEEAAPRRKDHIIITGIDIGHQRETPEVTGRRPDIAIVKLQATMLTRRWFQRWT